MNDTGFSHLDEKGRARMVDVSQKTATQREAIASGRVFLGEKAFNALTEGSVSKGDVLAVARVAGIMAAKKVDDLIPLCHPLSLSSVEVDFTLDSIEFSVGIKAKVKTNNVTGVEMEALTAVSIAALTIYDMCKAIEKGIVIKDIYLESKSGGKSGAWMRSF
ncbi:MAG: cyclic pyranopterin monophosphate synthase MoaC [Dissulfurimicrobium sp.]|uniref:cyclic pyranopterin monophosphate synthase MoaC n=1 Tax=Dissulfurimicrobium sp. TaxID=2022436 RepID=UPI00404B58E4